MKGVANTLGPRTSKGAQVMSKFDLADSKDILGDRKNLI